jgi:hypothetical protein
MECGVGVGRREMQAEPRSEEIYKRNNEWKYKTVES